MAVENILHKESFTSQSDLRTYQYHAVKLGSAAGTIAAITADTDVPIGVLQNAPNTGQLAEVAMCGAGGRSKLKTSAAVAFAALVGVAANGRGVTLAAANPTKYWIGVMAEATGAADEIGSVYLTAVPQPALTAN